jgi:hypothetical protein
MHAALGFEQLGRIRHDVHGLLPVLLTTVSALSA